MESSAGWLIRLPSLKKSINTLIKKIDKVVAKSNIQLINHITYVPVREYFDWNFILPDIEKMTIFETIASNCIYLQKLYIFLKYNKNEMAQLLLPINFIAGTYQNELLNSC